MFTAGTGTADSGLIDRDAWIAYLQAHPALAPSFARHAVGVPALPASVTAGDALAFPVTGLDLTSLGSPLNTTLDVRIDGTSIGSAAVTGGAAAVSVTVPAGTSGGAHVLTLVAAPSGTTVTLPLTVEPGLPLSTTTLTAKPSSQVFGATGHRVQLTATVAADVPVAGTVEFVSGQTVLGTATLRHGRASLTLASSTPAGTYDVVARYAGDATVAGSQSAPVTVVVKQATTRTSLQIGRNGAPCFWWATNPVVVAVRQDNGRLPSGVVELREGDTVVRTLKVTAGVAVGSLPGGLTSGKHTFTATFVPSDVANVAGSTSAPVTVTIRR